MHLDANYLELEIFMNIYFFAEIFIKKCSAVNRVRVQEECVFSPDIKHINNSFITTLTCTSTAGHFIIISCWS